MITKQDEAKIQTHQALVEHELPIPFDLNTDVVRLANVARTRNPAREYKTMVDDFPELVPYLLGVLQ